MIVAEQSSRSEVAFMAIGKNPPMSKRSQVVAFRLHRIYKSHENVSRLSQAGGGLSD